MRSYSAIALTPHAASPPPLPMDLGPSGTDIVVANRIIRIVSQLNVTGTEGAFGEDASLNEEMRKAAKLARAGRIDEIRPSHLGICASDVGGPSKPLQAIAGASTPLEAFRAFMSKMLQVVLKQHPNAPAATMDFFNSLTDVIVMAVKEGASWDDVTPFYKKIMEKASTNARLFAAGTAISQAPTFEKSWLEERSRYRCELDKAVCEAKIASGAQRAKQEAINAMGGASSKQRNNQLRKDDPPGNPQIQRARAKGVATGDAVLMPKDQKDPARVSFKKDHPNGHVAKKKKEMPACWDFHHPQGCKRGEKCDFYHQV